MNDQTIGTCSLCGGAVTVPGVYWSIVAPTPTCSMCGAVPLEAHGPVIPMRRAPQYPVTISGTTTVTTGAVIATSNKT